MPNNGWKPSRCRSCKRQASARHPVSFRGLCIRCSTDREVEAITQMVEKRGPLYDKWRESMIEASARVLAELTAN